MKLPLRLIVLFLLTALLESCNVELPPATSATVYRYDEGTPEQEQKLTEAQLRSLSLWFEQHRSGWSISYVSYVPNVYVVVQHAGLKQSSINIWPKTIIVNSGGRQMIQDFDPSQIKLLYANVGMRGG